MTEDEARKRWCPFARTYHPETDGDGETVAVASVNRGRDGAPDAWCLCIASDCMAWRWTSPPHWRVKRAQGITVAVDKDTPDAYQTRGNGYCGIAGKPETP